MELHELLTLDVESLSPEQAHQVAQDTIAALTDGVMASDQPKLKSLLIAAQQIATCPGRISTYALSVGPGDLRLR